MTLQTSLNYQEICPACGANWLEIKDALYDNGSDDWYVAMVIIKNCPTCQITFQELIKRLEGEEWILIN